MFNAIWRSSDGDFVMGVVKLFLFHKGKNVEYPKARRRRIAKFCKCDLSRIGLFPIEICSTRSVLIRLKHATPMENIRKRFLDESKLSAISTEQIIYSTLKFQGTDSQMLEATRKKVSS